MKIVTATQAHAWWILSVVACCWVSNS